MNAAVEVFGDRWSLIVLRDIMFGDKPLLSPTPDWLEGGRRLQHPG